MAFGRDPGPRLIQRVAKSDGCTWAGATYSSQTAARLQLATGRPVMPVGGFAGTNPSPTLEEFQLKAARGEICTSSCRRAIRLTSWPKRASPQFQVGSRQTTGQTLLTARRSTTSRQTAPSKPSKSPSGVPAAFLKRRKPAPPNGGTGFRYARGA